MLSCHTLSNTLDMSRKTLQTSRISSNGLYISCVMNISWLIQESAYLSWDFSHWGSETFH